MLRYLEIEYGKSIFSPTASLNTSSKKNSST